MISFLQSYFLYALAAVSLPFLIHLFNRRRSKRVQFSTIYFLQQLQQKKMRRLKIRQLLLLLLRALVIAFVVMGFARPTLRTHAFVLGKANVRTAAAIVLDNSMSMNYEDDDGVRYRKAVSAVERLLPLFEPGDKIALFVPCPVEGIPVGKPFTSRETVLKVLRGSSPTLAYGDMAGTLGDALGFLQKSEFPNKECFVISDFQRASWKTGALARLKGGEKSNIRSFLVDVGGETQENAGVERIRLRNQMIEPGKKVVLSAQIANYGSVDYRDLLVNIFLAGRRVGQSSVDLPGKARQEVSFNLILKKSGFVSGMVEVEDDPFLPDNRGYFTLFVPEKIPVLLIGNPDNLEYFKLALAPRPERQQLFSFTEAATLSRASALLRQNTVVVLADVALLSEPEAVQLGQFLRDGGHLIFFPGSHTDLRSLNERLLGPLKLPIIRGTQGEPGNEDAFVQWGQVDLKHPIFRGIFRGAVKEIDSPNFYFRVVFESSARGADLVKFEDGTPFLSLYPVGKGAVLLFASALDPAWSNLVYKPIFPPLIYRSVLFLASQSQRDVGYAQVGRPLETEVQDPEAEYVIQTPDGRVQKISPARSGTGLRVTFAGTAVPGIYTLNANGKAIREWAVNVDSRESELERIDLGEVKAKVGEPVAQLDGTRNFYEQIVRTRFGSELTRWFFAVAFGLMVLEMLLSSEGLLGRMGWIKKLLKEESS